MSLSNTNPQQEEVIWRRWRFSLTADADVVRPPSTLRRPLPWRLGNRFRHFESMDEQAAEEDPHLTGWKLPPHSLASLAKSSSADPLKPPDHNGTLPQDFGQEGIHQLPEPSAPKVMSFKKKPK